VSKHVDPLEDTRAESIRPGKLMAGAPIGGYELQHVLGEGGMGVVWCAHDPLLDRTIAIKVLKSKDVAAAMRTRLLREAQAMAAIKHPNVLTVHRVGTEVDRDYIVMELVDGGPLDHWLAFGPPDAEVMEALLAAGRGLAAAHAAGLVHRDFKPNNVLRSKDGRVLVTDFGLARGLGEDWTAPVGATGSLDPDARVTPSSRDNVLDAALTRTGALIGTPAYMAPEQFTGAEPDPRTDQFAYCVTVWQALTGARPFHGRTLDELRQAANQGVTAVIAQLDKQMRSVLTRGLDPDPAKRWPDMATLLRELERAGRPPKPRWPWIAGGVAVAVAAIAIAIAATRPAAAPACEPIDVAWGEAIKVQLPDHPWLAATLDDHERRWLASYDQTCKAARPGKVDCLRAVRSRIAAVSAMLAKEPSIRTSFDPALYLVPPEQCTVKGAVAVALPDDERALATLARSIVLPAGDAIEGDAKAWAPVLPLVAVTAGLRRIHAGEVSGGRAQLERALAVSDTDPRIAAFARLGLLEASLKELVHPEVGKAEVMHEELAKLLTYARSAIKAAGDEPVLLGQLAYLEAQALGDLAERSRKTSFGDAIARAGEARALFETAGDVRRAAQAATLLVELDLRRGDAATLGDGEFAARAAVESLARAKLPPSPLLEHALARIAFARNDLAAAHRYFDRIAPSARELADTAISGIVVGPDGKPVMNAVVVAWVGELHGDLTRAFTERRFDGEVVETDADGKFRVHLRLGTAVMAEAAGGALRSTPITLPASSGVTLRLSPTGEASGRIDSVVTAGVDAYARFSVHDTSWTVHAPITHGTFRVGNLPPGAYQLGAIGAAGTSTRRISNGTATISMTDGFALNKKLSWPGGRAIDVVVRGPIGPGATAWLVDAETATRFKRRDDLDALAATSLDGVWSPLIPIGSRITDAGRPHYVAGAHHAIFIGDYTSIAACIAPSAKPDAPVTCNALDPDGRSVAIDLPSR
jgi:hypothetical protein